VVEGFGFRQRDWRSVVSLAQLDKRGGRDGAFEVQMEFRLRQAANEGLDVVHASSLVGDLSNQISNRHLGLPVT